jgi:hypothetical protein
MKTDNLIPVNVFFENQHTLLYNSYCYLVICNYINHPSKFEESITYENESIDMVILDRLLKNSYHFQKYQWFSWQLYIIEFHKLLSKSRFDTSSFNFFKIKYLKNDAKSYQMVNDFYEENDTIINNIYKFRSKKFAHSDFSNEIFNEVTFRECFQLFESSKVLFENLVKIYHDATFLFPKIKDAMPVVTEFEHYYNAKVPPKSLKDKIFLEWIVGRDYLLKKGIIKS